MQAASYENSPVMEMPVGGIMDFVTGNMDEFDDREIAFGQASGINSLAEIGSRMASYGRNEDEYMAHLAKDEIVVPRQVAQNNPQLVSNIRDAIYEEGADPDAYVVGHEANSINPETLQREFFFKKLFKSIKKVVKKVGKVLKKAAKVVVPIALNFIAPGLGTIASAAIGSAVGGLIQGESLGEALKSGLKGGLTAGVISGTVGAIGSIGNSAQTLGQGFKSGVLGGLPVQDGTAFNTRFGATYKGPDATMKAPTFMESLTGKTGRNLAGYVPPPGTAQAQAQAQAAAQAQPGAAPDPSAAADKTFFQKSKEFLGIGPKPDASQAYLDAYEKIASDAAARGLSIPPEQIAKLATDATKTSLLATTAKVGLPALGVAAATGAFDPIPAEEIDLSQFGEDVSQTTEDLISENPGDYLPGTPGDPNYVDPSQVVQAISSGQPTNFIDDYSGQVIAPSNTYAELTPTGGGTIQPSGGFQPSGGGASTYVPAPVVAIPGYNPDVTGFRPAPLYGMDQNFNPVYSPYAETVAPAQTVGFPSTFMTEEDRLLAEQQMLQGQQMPVAYAANGGGMSTNQFPRRVGQIEGPGTERSDSIPAMLSDGEFVMTAQAVRNAGNGSREQGFRKMYDIMRRFEGGAVA